MNIIHKGMLMVLSGPSGVGKGTLYTRLLHDDESFTFSTSVTTRAPRTGERNGIDYFFISDAEYDKLLSEDAFVEHATVHAHRYGTLKSQVYEKLESGKNILLDIDPQGALAVMAKCPDCVSVFIMPPDYETLRIRLHTRNTDDEQEIEKRLRNAHGEIALFDRYDYVIINDDLETAYRQLKCVVEAEKMRTIRFIPDIQ